MSVSLQSASVYTDLQSLEAVKQGADKNSPETLRFVAQQFEALLIQTMLKSGRDSQQDEDGLFDSQQSEFYQDLHDKQMGLHLAQGQGIGIADMLVQQLRAARGQDLSIGSATAGRSLSDYLSARVQSPPAVSVEQAAPSAASEPAQETPPLGTPEAFVQQLWPHAKQAAESLGVDPVVLLAQAALETGWGQHIIQQPDGRSSHNLFNIKADGRWSGDTVGVASLEYRDGVAKREHSQFRAYDSYAESFADYAAFLQQSPRYQSALAAGRDGARFASELASAGYATDPNYANKIIGIVQGEPLGKALGTLKII